MRILRFVLAVAWIVLCVISSNYMLKNEAVISWLKSKQLSIYFVSDTILLLVFVIAIFMVGVLLLEKTQKIKIYFISELLVQMILFLFIAYFTLKFTYGHISRPKVGWFYKVPAGEGILYPRNEKNEIEDSFLK